MCGQVWITDSLNHLRLAPVGAIGEIIIESPTLARHYLNNDVATEKAFPSLAHYLDPAHEPVRVYRTGDLAQYLPNGDIIYVGRRDAQVKISGQRVELPGIENRMKELLPDNAKAAAVVIRPSGRDPVLVGYAAIDHVEDLTDDEIEATKAQLKIDLRECLPPHMVPSLLISVPEIPMSRTGKVDRALLARKAVGIISDGYSDGTAHDARRPPSSKIELVLRELWIDVLNVAPNVLGARANFLHFGDSIAAMKLAKSARKKGLSLNVASVMRHPILSDMAMHLDTNVADYQPSQARTIPPYSLLSGTSVSEVQREAAISCGISISQIDDIMPCTPLQEGLMALSLKHPGTYIAQEARTLNSFTDIAKFRAAWDNVAQNNEIMRMRVVESGKCLVQVVCRKPISWDEPEDLVEYLRESLSGKMGLGQPLTRFAMLRRDGDVTFVLTRHHVTFDGYSVGLIDEQHLRAYAGESIDRPPAFANFAQHLSIAGQGNSAEYWRNELEGVKATNFPVNLAARRHDRSDAVWQQDIHFTRPQQLTATVSTLLRSAWGVLIAKHCLADDIIIGTTVSGRNAPVDGIDEMTAPTITTVPVRIRLRQSQTVTDFLSQMQHQSSRMIPHEHYGLQSIRKLGEDGEIACRFAALLIVNPEIEALSESIYVKDSRPEDCGNCTCTFAITLQVWLKPFGAQAIVVYDDDLVTEPYITKLISQFEHVIQQLCSRPIATLGDLSTLSPADEAQIRTWTEAPIDFVERCVHSIFSDHVSKAPNSSAVLAWDGTLTYLELDDLSTRLAFHLVDRGVGPEKVVAICFEKSLWTTVCVLGTIKAGGAFLLLDPEHPYSRLQTIVDDVQATIVLTSDKQVERSRMLSDKICIISSVFVRTLPRLHGCPCNAVLPRNTLYYIFSSGTTGKPKGAFLDHQAFASSALAARKALKMSASTKALHFSSHSFDISVFDLFATVLSGGTVCIPSDYERNNDLVGAINRLQVNFMTLTPSVARTLHPNEIPSVTAVQLCGEPMGQQDFERWRHIQLFDGWGPAECAAISGYQDITDTMRNVDSGQLTLRRVGLQAASSINLYLVEPNNHHQLAPIGGLGEIVIDGVNVAKGYLNDPERTAQAFVQRPAWLFKGALPTGRCLYKTGDLGRYGLDGSVIYVGRKDASQVKIRGQRLELGEVENYIQRFLPADTQVVVEPVRPTDGKDPMLVAFLYPVRSSSTEKENVADAQGVLSNIATDMFDPPSVRDPQWAANLRIIESQLSQAVPDYMIPSAWVPMTRLPSSHSNKVDRGAMRTSAAKLTVAQLAAFSGMLSEIRKPETDLEKRLCHLWANVLEIDEDSIGVDHSWFRLGGNSIDAMKLASVARKNRIKLTVTDVFEHPRLGDLGAICMRREDNTMADESGPVSLQSDIRPFALLDPSCTKTYLRAEAAQQCCIDTTSIEDVYPCTPLQQGLMAVSIKTPGREMAQFTFLLSPDIDVERLKTAWQTVAQAASALRTRIIETISGTWQVVVAEALEWPNGENLDDYLEHDRQRHMVLGGKLCRFALITDSVTGDSQLCLSIHHAMYDGWSLSLIVRLVEDNYRGLTSSVSPRPFNTFIAHLLLHHNKETERQFWSTQLADAHAEVFPKLPHVAYTPSANAFIEKAIVLEELSVSSEFTISTLLRAAWAIVIGSHTGSEDVIYGSTVHGRNVAVQGIEGILGPTFTTIPVRIQVDKSATVERYLHCIQQDTVATCDFEHMGLQNIRDINDVTRAACGFQNVLVVQPEETSANPHSLLGPMQYRDDPSSLNSYAMMLDVRPNKKKVSFGVSYDSRVVDPRQMQRIIDQTMHILSQLRDPSMSARPLSVLNVASPQDIRDIAEWNCQPPVTVHECIHNVIDRQVHRNPNAEAVCAWDGSYTYHQIDCASSRLAAQLLALGAQRNMIIPLCFDKSKWTVVAILAVMKSGSAFVLLDPAHHPVKRMKGLIHAVRGEILLCGPKYKDIFLEDVRNVTVLAEDEMKTLPESYLAGLDASSPEDMLCVLFTSGSTGNPKGIVHDHAGFGTSFDAFRPALGIDSATRLLQFSAYAFDACVGDILAPLMHGGCVCIPSEEQRMNDVTRAINDLRANWALLTPSFARSLDPVLIPGLRTVLLGGETILLSDEVHWSDRTLLTGYGPAESSLCVSAAIGKDAGRHAPNLGWPIACRTWITEVSDHTKLAPIGAGGHLVIEGPVNAAGGYLNEPEKTSASFIKEHVWVPSCRSPTPQRFFKTGDLVRYASDGALIFMGRLDTQIKLRGQRVEVDEVEFHLGEALSKAVQGAALSLASNNHVDSAIAMTSRPGMVDRSSLAVFVCHGPWCDWSPEVGKALSSLLSYLKRTLAERLPSYMLPSVIIPLPKLPLTTSGKVDRKALTKIASDMSEEQLAMYTRTALTGRQPSNDTERQLIGLFAEVLGCDDKRVYADDSLVRLGGDSISAMRLVALARAKGLTLTVADIFQHGTPEQLARSAARTDITDDRDPVPFSNIDQAVKTAVLRDLQDSFDLVPASVEDIYPCTALQTGLMSLSAVRNGAYIATNVFEIPQAMEMDRLQVSWKYTVRRNSILRTRIVSHGDAFYQVVTSEEVEIPVTEGDKGDLNVTYQGGMGLGCPLNTFRIVIDSCTAKRYFVWNSHHSTYDGWSMRLLLDQWGQLYSGAKPEPLPAFSRFISHLHHRDETSANFWRSQLERLEPTTFPSVPLSSYEPQGTSLLNAHIDLQRRDDTVITISTFIRAAWAVTLSHWSGDSDSVLMGCVMAGRSGAIPGIDRLAGPTLTTVPVAISVDKSELVVEFLDRVQKQWLDMIPHEQYGLQNIARLSDACKFAAQFQNLLAIQPAETYDVCSNELMTLLPSGERDSDFFTYGLTMQCLLGKQGFDVKVNYDSFMISHGAVNRLIEQFRSVVVDLASVEGKKQVGDLRIVSPAHQEQIASWNSLPFHTNCRICTHERIMEVAVHEPDRPAVRSWDEELTYRSLVSRSTKLAGLLRDFYSIGPGSFVPVCFEKSVWAVVSQMAVLQVGAAFVPVDPSYPTDRLQQILSQVGTAPILTSRETARVFRGFQRTVVQVSAQLINSHDRNLDMELCSSQAQLSDLMYIIFTSGSTGQPKGVMMEHGSFDDSSQQYGAALGITANSRVLQFASYVFDASILETFTTLSYGGCVCIPSDAERTADLSQIINNAEVNWALLTPSILRSIDPETVPGLETLVVGAEAVEGDVVENWSGHVKLYQAYGPAEASIVCTVAAIDSTECDPRNIGRPVNCRAWIVQPSDHEHLAGLGCIGELLVEGPTLARGYLADKVKTDKAFIHAPQWYSLLHASGSKGNLREQRFYKTGDLVRYAADGSIVFVGRKDTQIKIRGQRVEVGDIEQSIRSLCAENVGVAVELVNGISSKTRPSLTAAIAFKTTKKSSDVERPVRPMDASLREKLVTLQSRLKETLPSHMIPQIFLPLTCMPLGHAGKVDRRKLQALAQSLSPEEVTTYALAVQNGTPPSTPRERDLEPLWANVLGIGGSGIRVEDDFFHSGDSISAIRLSTAARNFGFHLTAADIFRLRKFSAIARAMTTFIGRPERLIEPFSLIPASTSRSSALAHLQRVYSIDAADVEDIYPCLGTQEYLMRQSLANPGANVMYMVYHLDENLNLGRFKLAWECTVKCTDILRTRLVEIEYGKLFQVLLRGSVTWQGGNSAQEYLDQDQMKHAGLGQPLARYAIIPSQDAVDFVWTIHHSLYDGWSLPLILRRVEAAYLSLAAGNEASLKPGIFKLLVKHTMSGIEQQEKQFWVSELDGAIDTGFPAQRPLEQPHATQFFEAWFALQRKGAPSPQHSIATVIRAAWAVVLSEHSESPEVNFGMFLSGRTASVPDIEEIVGPAVAKVPVRVKLATDMRISALLSSIQEQATRTMPFEQTGIHRIESFSASCRSACRFQTLLVIHPPQVSSAFESKIGMNKTRTQGFHPYALVIEAVLGGSGEDIMLQVSWDERALTRPQAKALLLQIRRVMKQLLDENMCDSLARDLEVL